MSLHVTQLTVGQMQENCYIVHCLDTNECLIIDPGDDASYIAEKILSMQVKPIGIVATHGHFDHVLAACELQLVFTNPFMIHENDAFLLDRMSETAAHFLKYKIVEMKPTISKTIRGGDVLPIGNCSVQIIETSGHTPGSISLYDKKSAVIFVGDLIFAGGGVGRTDFSYCRPLDLHDSIQTVLQLPPHTTMYAGHGEKTTVENEIVYH